MSAQEHEAPTGLVAGERRRGDRRASHLHIATPADACGKSFTTHERAHTETLLVETQAAADHALEALAHAVAASQTLLNELRSARAASVASRRAAHLAAGQVSGSKS